MLVLVALTRLPVEAQSNRFFILATTTSTQDSGLLDVLVPRFEKESGIEVKVIAVGTGAALRWRRGGRRRGSGHAPAAERSYAMPEIRSTAAA